MSNTNSQSVRTRYHRVVDETLKSIVLEVTIPGTDVKATIRVPKKLCRNWTNDSVDIYSGDDGKSYRDRLHMSINRLESKVERYRKFLAEQGIEDPCPDDPF